MNCICPGRSAQVCGGIPDEHKTIYATSDCAQTLWRTGGSRTDDHVAVSACGQLHHRRDSGGWWPHGTQRVNERSLAETRVRTIRSPAFSGSATRRSMASRSFSTLSDLVRYGAGRAFPLSGNCLRNGSRRCGPSDFHCATHRLPRTSAFRSWRSPVDWGVWAVPA